MNRDAAVMFKNRVAVLNRIMQIIQRDLCSREVSILWSLPPFQILCILELMLILQGPDVVADEKQIISSDEQNIETAIHRCRYGIMADGTVSQRNGATATDVPPGTHVLLRSLTKHMREDLD